MISRLSLVAVTLFAIASPLSAGILDGSAVQFDVGLGVPMMNRIAVTIELGEGRFVSASALLRFDEKGKLVCGAEDCQVDGIDVDAKGKLKPAGDDWKYTIVFKSALPKLKMKVTGLFGESFAKVRYSGPKGKRTVKDAAIISTASTGFTVARIELNPLVDRRGRITGTGDFSSGFGEELSGTLSGRLVGDFLLLKVKAGKKKLVFAGFELGEGGESYTGTLKYKIPPEKGFVPDYTFPRELPEIPPPKDELERQKPFVLRATFPLRKRRTGRTFRPDDANPPKAADFRIIEGSQPIDSRETNQFLETVRKKLLDVALVLDFTGSMDEEGFIEPMIESTAALICGMSENTSIALYGFWERQGGFRRITDYTRCTEQGRASLICALKQFSEEDVDHGATEIWNVLDIALDQFPEREGEISRSLVFLSDGHDTSSTVSPADIVREARQKDVVIFALGLNASREDEDTLKSVSKDTGGESETRKVDRGSVPAFGVIQCDPPALGDFCANPSDDAPDGLRELFRFATDRLANDWILSYVTLKSGGAHTLTIETTLDVDDFPRIHSFEVDETLVGDIRQGALELRQDSSGRNEYILYATYVPRGIDGVRIAVDSPVGVEAVEFLEGDGLLRGNAGWTRARDGNEWLAEGPALKYGSFGSLFLIRLPAAGPLTVRVLNEIYDDVDGDGKPDKQFAFGGVPGRDVITVEPEPRSGE